MKKQCILVMVLISIAVTISGYADSNNVPILPNLNPPGGFRDSDDALHPYDTENYFEWWYLDTQFDNGYTCALTYSLRNRVGSVHIPLVIIDIYRPDGTKARGIEMRDESECSASIEKCDVIMGNDFLRQEGDMYLLSMHASDLGAELTFKRTVPPWKWSESGFIVDNDSGQQGWVNAIPRGDVQGIIWIDGKQIEVSGEGYHDHNWGDTDMFNCFSGWGWGRMYDEEYTYVYGWLMDQDSGKAQPSLYLAKDGEVIFASNNMQCELSDYGIYPETGDNIPNHIFFSGEENDVGVSCQLDIEDVLEANITNDVTTGISTHYYRRLNSFHGTIKMNDDLLANTFSNNALNEFVKFVSLSQDG